MQPSPENNGLLTEAERKELVYLLHNSDLITGGFTTTRWVKRTYSNSTYTDGEWSWIERGKYKLKKIKDGNDSIKVYIKREGLFFAKWVAVSGPGPDKPGPWWEAIRQDLPKMREELRKACMDTGGVAPASSGALSLTEEKK